MRLDATLAEWKMAVNQSKRFASSSGLFLKNRTEPLQRHLRCASLQTRKFSQAVHRHGRYPAIEHHLHSILCLKWKKKSRWWPQRWRPEIDRQSERVTPAAVRLPSARVCQEHLGDVLAIKIIETFLIYLTTYWIWIFTRFWLIQIESHRVGSNESKHSKDRSVSRRSTLEHWKKEIGFKRSGAEIELSRRHKTAVWLLDPKSPFSLAERGGGQRRGKVLVLAAVALTRLVNNSRFPHHFVERQNDAARRPMSVLF